MPPQEAQKVHQILDQLPQVIKIFLRDLDNLKLNGMTNFATGGPFCAGKRGVRSNIFLDRTLLDSVDSASPNELLRLWLQIAATLAHEVTHAMFNAWEGTVPEPAFGDSLECEVGNAFEEHVFGGVGREVEVCDTSVIEIYYKVLEKHGVLCKHLS